jgi:DNA-binding transcriptional MerR regulator
MYLIRELASKYGLTRTTLLHYDSIGLLVPKNRSESGYRMYSDEDEKRLKDIILFRSLGLSLEQIKQVLLKSNSKLPNMLFKRLHEINGKIDSLKNRQRNIIRLLEHEELLRSFTSTDGPSIHELLENIDPEEWHRKFEEISPENHKKIMELFKVLSETDQKLVLEIIQNFPQKLADTIRSTLEKSK